MRILDCQSWKKIKDINNNIEDIKRNFNAVQIPPVQPHKNAGGAFWEMYQVNGFSIVTISPISIPALVNIVVVTIISKSLK